MYSHSLCNVLGVAEIYETMLTARPRTVCRREGWKPSRRVAVQGCEEGKPAAHNEGTDRVSQLHSAFPECGGRIRSPTVDMVCDAAVGA